MRSFISAPVFLATCIVASLALSGEALPDQRPDKAGAYYVAVDGSDDNDGTMNRPFASLGKAQVMMRSSAIKTTYLRAGTFHDVALKLGAADSGETWRYFPADGCGRVVLDGGASRPGTGRDVITIIGGSRITINGFVIQNFNNWGIGIHGGAADAIAGFPDEALSSDRVSIVNNIIRNGFTNANQGWAGGGLWADGQVTNLTVGQNAVLEQYGSGIRVGANGDGAQPKDLISGLSILNNAVLRTNLATADNGAIYVQDQNFRSTHITIEGNFIRDYQSLKNLRNSNPTSRDVAIYLDRGASHVTVARNIIAATAEPIVGSPAVSSTQALFLGSGHHNRIFGNVIDLGVGGLVMDLAYEHYYRTDPDMPGNSVTGNIFIGNWSGEQVAYALGVGPYAFASGGELRILPRIKRNLYFNYGGGQISTQGNAIHDSDPITNTDPQLSGWTYELASGSPVLQPPLNFVPAVQRWGPACFEIPRNGTAPSYMTAH
jgi:hypothetical protein